MQKRRLGYVIAVMAPALTIALRVWIGDRLEAPTLILLTLPIIVSAYVGGAGPGIVATLTSAAGASYYLLEPVYSFEVASSTQRLQQLILLATGLIVSVLCEDLHRTSRMLTEQLRALEQTRDELRISVKETSELRTALDAHAIVAITDSAGRITFVNDKFCAISQYSRDELIGQDHRIINSSHHPKEFIRGLWTTIARGGVWHGEIRNRAKDGSFYWVATTIVPFLKEDGRPRQYVAIRADITERKVAEERLREAHGTLEQKVIERTAELNLAKERAESADRLKSEFLASMSHELRTPLNAIIGFSEFLVDEKPGPLLPKQKEYLGDVLNSARHLLQLINDVLDLSKVEAGKMTVNPRRFQVSTAVTEVLAVVKAIAMKKRITVTDEVAADIPPVFLDDQKLKQGLYNLLSNAVKFTDEGGRVDVRASRLRGDRLQLEVADTGIGISPENQKRLFNQFEQLNAGEARRFEGTGLGLALTRKIVELQGGRVHVQSEVGVGSTFTIELPLETAEAHR